MIIMLWNLLWNLIAFIITMGLLITVHELGHFCAALFFGVKIERLSIGFGPVLWKWKGSIGIEYVISVIPLGGYVKLLHGFDSNEENYQRQPNNAFYSKSIWQRSVIIVSGSAFNIFFSIFLYVLVYITGVSVYKPVIQYILPGSFVDDIKIPVGSEIKFINGVCVNSWESVRLNMLDSIKNKEKIIVSVQMMHADPTQITTYIIDIPENWLHFNTINTFDPVSALGIFPCVLNVTSIKSSSDTGLYCKSPKNLLKIGDKILLINKQPIYNWLYLTRIIKNNPNQVYHTTIIRNNQMLDINLLLGDIHLICSKNNTDDIDLYLQANVDIMQQPEIHKCGLYSAMLKSIDKTVKIIILTINALYQLMIGNTKSIDLHGPIVIAQSAGSAMAAGISSYLVFLSMVSINLGIINLFPLPILDGGQLCLLFIERLKGIPLSKQVQNIIYTISFIILFLLMILILYNDITESR